MRSNKRGRTCAWKGRASRASTETLLPRIRARSPSPGTRGERKSRWFVGGGQRRRDMTRMTDDERRERAKAMLEFPVARMCQEFGQEHNRRLEWDAWGSQWFLVRLDGERRRVEVPED